jgi:hypothetical protein
MPSRTPLLFYSSAGCNSFQREKNPDNPDSLAIQMILCNMAIRWNLIYNMLVFALECCNVINKILKDKEMRKYELEEEKWGLVQQLCDILEVCYSTPSLLISVTHTFSAFQRCDLVLFIGNTKPSNQTVIPVMNHILQRSMENSQIEGNAKNI